MIDSRIQSIAETNDIALYARYSVEEVAQLLSIKTSLLIQHIKKGRIACLKFDEREYLFFGYQIIDYLLSLEINISEKSIIDSFPNLVEDEIISIDEVRKLLGGVSRSSIYRWMGSKIFPENIRLNSLADNGAMGWRKNEVMAFIHSRKHNYSEEATT